ncbi:MAG: hypothetical protein JJ971_09685 [Balneolaceae bacterium]|nr:hypothetical protein [Balneolaceae bacterium]MBO6546483.1 hypothetical protein [Balneolaceae bacterium]MBO6648842.1 hypothetical protein [Balneolaceae bacterium]
MSNKNWTNFICFNDGQKQPAFTGNIISLASSNFNNFPKTIWAVEKLDSGNKIWRWDYNSNRKLSYSNPGGSVTKLDVRFALENGVHAPQAWGFEGQTIKYWPANAQGNGDNWINLSYPENTFPSNSTIVDISCSNTFGIFILCSADGQSSIYQWKYTDITKPYIGSWEEIFIPPSTEMPSELRCISVADRPRVWDHWSNGLIWAVDNNGKLWGTGQYTAIRSWSWNIWLEFKKPPPISKPDDPYTSYNLLTVDAGGEQTLAAIRSDGTPLEWGSSQSGYQFNPKLNSRGTTPNMKCVCMDEFGWDFASSDGATSLLYYIA